MKEAITEQELANLLVSKVDFNLKKVYDIDEIFSYLEDDGWEEEVEYETNGYQVDWWKTYKKGSILLELVGSMWYTSLEGRFILLSQKVSNS